VAGSKVKEQMGGDEVSEELLLIALTQMYRVMVEVPGTDEVF
jgi:hypothetical protein